MGEHRATTPHHSRRRRLAAVGLSSALAVGAVTVMSGSAHATDTFNPFEANQGFTIVAQGDATLGNNELEGSIAAFGSIASNGSTGGGAPYPLIHSAAGTGDYTVPTIDDAPVRVLADRFVGSKHFEQTNRGASAGSNEAVATSRFVDIDNLQGSSRGNDFLRVTNSEGGIFDLNQVGYSPTALSGLQTQRDSVEAYFPDLNAQVAQTNRCLDGLYGTDGLGNQVQVDDQGGMVFVEGFATDQVNVIDYEAIAGKIIKLDRAGGYRPTAEAPLVVRVSEGTTDIGRLNFEGWSAAGDGQRSARYIMLDLSNVTNPVTVDGLEMGALWAPQADVTFDSNTTTNGQWFAQNVRTGPSAGEIHHQPFLGQLPCGTPAPPAEPDPDPSIGTTVAVDGSDDKVLPLTGGTVTDTVAYENLTPGTEYTLRGEIHDVATGESTGITAEATFTPTGASGTTDVTFTLTAEDVADYAGQDLVVFEYLYVSTDSDTLIADHTDPHDEAQTFTVADEEEPPVVTLPEEPEQAVSDSVSTDLPGSATTGTTEGSDQQSASKTDSVLPGTGAGFSQNLLFVALLMLATGAALLLPPVRRRA